MRIPTTLAATALLIIAVPVHAQEPDAAQTPCTGPVWWAESDSTYSDFDFWVGKWQAFDREPELMVGVDHVRRELAGCIVVQHWPHERPLHAAEDKTGHIWTPHVNQRICRIGSHRNRRTGTS